MIIDILCKNNTYEHGKRNTYGNLMQEPKNKNTKSLPTICFRVASVDLHVSCSSLSEPFLFRRIGIAKCLIQKMSNFHHYWRVKWEAAMKNRPCRNTTTTASKRGFSTWWPWRVCRIMNYRQTCSRNPVGKPISWAGHHGRLMVNTILSFLYIVISSIRHMVVSRRVFIVNKGQ